MSLIWSADGYPGWSADGWPGWSADGYIPSSNIVTAVPVFTVNAVGIPYLLWQPTPTSTFWFPSGNYRTVEPIVVGPNPFTWKNTFGTTLVIIGGGLVTSVVANGLPVSSFTNDGVTVFSGNSLVVNYVIAPAIYRMP